MLAAGREHDRTLPLDPLALPPGGLRSADLGFFDLGLFGALAARGGYWLSRPQAGTVVCAPDGARLDLLAELRAADRLDRPVLVGAAAQLPARLLAVRVPQAVAEARRRALRAAARRRGQAVSAARLALAAWTILVSNVPPALLALDEALVLLRARAGRSRSSSTCGRPTAASTRPPAASPGASSPRSTPSCWRC
ncbi:MAG TPA: hypothetical protein VFL91_28660 [Thermomicrobiales bacterium]|nr:hypothetical protein [Thermomicrobiales bacterium]